MKVFKKIMILSLILGACLAMGCTDSSDDYSSTDSSSYSTPTNTEYFEYDMTWYKQKTIGYQTAPSGYTHAICTLYIKNYADEPISTYAGNWKFVANGVVYDYDSVIYSDYISYNSVDIIKGGEFETQFVYLISDDVNTGYMVYDEYGAPEMRPIKYYKTAADVAAEEQQELDEISSMILTKLQSHGYPITDAKFEDNMVYITVESLDDVKNMFDICSIVYEMRYDINRKIRVISYDYVVYVEDYPDLEFRTSQTDVREYTQHDYYYEEKVTVIFPNDERVTYGELDEKLDELMEE
ncbi:hypothetical protein [Methanococcoides sp. NM1]|uniref:hypothetical protein n=1 Tax=Methanococcoides sp. NM1 TaxID=1201013 RepID=UPI00108399B3|nr:hypothetical protein [Methanococcoides sp. NM1]